jgi:hypothetical protein
MIADTNSNKSKILPVKFLFSRFCRDLYGILNCNSNVF